MLWFRFWGAWWRAWAVSPPRTWEQYLAQHFWDEEDSNEEKEEDDDCSPD